MALALTALSQAVDWREFRGPYGNGIAEVDAPVRCCQTEGVEWKIDVPRAGWSTPVITKVD